MTGHIHPQNRAEIAERAIEISDDYKKIILGMGVGHISSQCPSRGPAWVLSESLSSGWQGTSSFELPYSHQDDFISHSRTALYFYILYMQLYYTNGDVVVFILITRLFIVITNSGQFHAMTIYFGVTVNALNEFFSFSL